MGISWYEIFQMICKREVVRFVGINSHGRLCIVKTEHVIMLDGEEIIDLTAVGENGKYEEL